MEIALSPANSNNIMMSLLIVHTFYRFYLVHISLCQKNRVSWLNVEWFRTVPSLSSPAVRRRRHCSDNWFFQVTFWLSENNKSVANDRLEVIHSDYVNKKATVTNRSEMAFDDWIKKRQNHIKYSTQKKAFHCSIYPSRLVVVYDKSWVKSFNSLAQPFTTQRAHVSMKMLHREQFALVNTMH